MTGINDLYCKTTILSLPLGSQNLRFRVACVSEHPWQSITAVRSLAMFSWSQRPGWAAALRHNSCQTRPMKRYCDVRWPSTVAGPASCCCCCCCCPHLHNRDGRCRIKNRFYSLFAILITEPETKVILLRHYNEIIIFQTAAQLIHIINRQMFSNDFVQFSVIQRCHNRY